MMLLTSDSFPQDFAPKLLVFGDMGRHGGAPSLNALIKETQTGQYAAALHVGDFAYDLASDGGEVSAQVCGELFCR